MSNGSHIISFVVPAHNEEALLAATLQAIHTSAEAVGQPYEIIVANDASTDATAEIARQNGARVIDVNHRKIAATRNSGARVATGDRLFFVDADTQINARAVASSLRAMDRGAVGGGALTWFGAGTPLWGHVLFWWFAIIVRAVGVVGGAFLFATREGFDKTGGFDERLFAGEDAEMSLALTRLGRFAVIWPWVTTSGRRLYGLRGAQALFALFRMGFNPKAATRETVARKVWYDSDRRDSSRASDVMAGQLVNLILLWGSLVMVSDPVLVLVPKWRAMMGETLATVWWVTNIILCHLGLVLAVGSVMFASAILMQTRWSQRIRFLALSGVCGWLGFMNIREVIAFWAYMWARVF